MKIWIITIGEPLPIETAGGRLLRTGLLCPILVGRGHQVTWWTSTFAHAQKQHVAADGDVIEIKPGYTLRFLDGGGYRRNVSVSRLVDHFRLARKFRKRARAAERPDIILCSFPTIELSAQAARYGQEFGVPVVLDIRDLWPDIFVDFVPHGLKAAARAALSPYFVAARNALVRANAIFAINEKFLEWGLKRAGRATRPFDTFFPMAYPAAEPPADAQGQAMENWRKRGVTNSEKPFKVIFVGALSRHFEFDTVLGAAQLMRDSEVQFIICGAGDFSDEIDRAARELPNVIAPGWIGPADIAALMKLAHAGLSPYRNEESFNASLPNKSIEYLHGGLPIVSSLPGALERLLSEKECGLTYCNHDPAALCSAIETLRGDPARRQRMAQNAKALFEARFRADVVYGKMAGQLEAIATSRR